jgi:hypothetical protein
MYNVLIFGSLQYSQPFGHGCARYQNFYCNSRVVKGVRSVVGLVLQMVIYCICGSEGCFYVVIFEWSEIILLSLMKYVNIASFFVHVPWFCLNFYFLFCFVSAMFLLMWWILLVL